MKLSDVQVAHQLVADRRSLVKSFVLARSAKNYEQSLFGIGLDEQLVEALRKAARDEIRRRIGQCDDRLAKLGVEVDGIEITIKAEEAEMVAAEEAADE